jgi:LPS-assembly protein
MPSACKRVLGFQPRSFWHFAGRVICWTAPTPLSSKGVRRAVWAAAVFAVLNSTAVASTPALTDLSADNVTIASGSGEWVAQGRARLRDADSLFTADEIRYNPATEGITARGHVVYTRGDARLLADLLVYQRRDGTFTARNVRIGRPPAFVAGQSADGTPTRIVVHKATVSYGEPGRWAPTIKADTIILVPGRYLRLGSGRAGIGSAQVVPIPRFTQALAGGAPVFSYLSADVGYRSTLGGVANIGLRVPTSPDLRLGGDLGIYTSRGVMAGPAVDYGSTSTSDALAMSGYLRSGFIHDYGIAPAGSSGPGGGFITGNGTALDFIAKTNVVSTDILGNPISQNRGFIEWMHQQELTDAIDLRGQFNWWKDSNILRDFRPRDFYPDQEPDSSLEAVYTGDDAVASAFARFQPNSFEAVQERLPELSYDELPTAIGDGFYERFDTSAVRLVERPPGGGTELSDNRLDGFYGISRPIIPDDWLAFTPVAGARVTNYSDTRGAADPGGYTRFLGEVGFDALLRSSGVFAYSNPLWGIDGLRHLLTPEISYRYIPEGDAGRASIPDIDRPTFSTYLQPLDLGDMRTIDDLHSENTLRLGLDNILQTRNPAYGSRDLLAFNVADDLQFHRQPGQHDFSELHTETVVSPAPWINFSADQIFKAQTFSLREFDAGFDIHNDRDWGVRLTSDFLRHEDDDYLLDCYKRLNEVYTFHELVEYDARQFRFNQVSSELDQNLANIWRVKYIVTFNAGPNSEGHFGFDAEIDALKF